MQMVIFNPPKFHAITSIDWWYVSILDWIRYSWWYVQLLFFKILGRQVLYYFQQWYEILFQYEQSMLFYVSIKLFSKTFTSMFLKEFSKPYNTWSFIQWGDKHAMWNILKRPFKTLGYSNSYSNKLNMLFGFVSNDFSKP